MEFHPTHSHFTDSPSTSTPSSPSTPSTPSTPSNSIISFSPPTVHPHSIHPLQRTFSNLQYLTPSQLQQYDQTGCLVIPSNEIWSVDELKLIISSVNMMEDWLDTPGKWMKYYEINTKALPDSTNNKLLQRLENFTQYNPGLDYILNGNKMIGITSELFNAASILYKEKINYKLGGGGGFAAHQDVAAGWWMYGQSLHLSCLVCIDPATPANGCLEVAYSSHKDGMLSEPWKELPSAVTEKLDWVSLQTNPGDVVFFDSFVPHRSGPNETQNPRRALYATYAIASEGDFRDKYYADKRISFPPDIERLPGQKYEYKI